MKFLNMDNPVVYIVVKLSAMLLLTGFVFLLFSLGYSALFNLCQFTISTHGHVLQPDFIF